MVSNPAPEGPKVLFSNPEALDYLGSGAFNWGWSSTLQDSGPPGGGLDTPGLIQDSFTCYHCELPC